MKKKYFLIVFSSLFALLLIGIYSCSSTSQIASAKGGAQLWGENCVRCHNTPSPETFSDVEWDVAVMHMRVRANLSNEESTKIAEFLKIAN